MAQASTDRISLTIDGYEYMVTPDVAALLQERPDVAAKVSRECGYGADDRAEYLEQDHCYEYRVDDKRSVYVYVGPGSIYDVEIAQPGLENYIHETMDLYDGEDNAQHMQHWGYDGLDYLDKAEPGFDGPCRVWRKPNYYQGTCGAPQPDYARDEQYIIREFDGYAAAAAYVNEYYSAPSGYDGIPECNVLAHGQAGADTLTIVEA